jgi:mRNA interferase MazF
LKRGDIVTVALQGDLGKPRPAVVVESDRLAPGEHVLICAGTSFVREHVEPRRILIEPSGGNGLREPTQFQLDKLTFARRTKCGPVIGRLEAEEMVALSRMLIVLLGLAD